MGERNSPTAKAFLVRDFEQAIQAPRARRGERHVLRGREEDRVAGGDVGARNRRHGDVRFAGLGGGECGEEAELVAVGETPPLDDDAREETEACVDDCSCDSVEIRLLRLERRVLKPGEGGAELLVRAAVDPATDRAKKRM